MPKYIVVQIRYVSMEIEAENETLAEHAMRDIAGTDSPEYIMAVEQAHEEFEVSHEVKTA